ncbi:MAG: competence/damage-inducible protein A [Planctomycetota bacterium]
MQAILLSIGDELALGQTVDTNTAWVAARLATLGISTVLHETVSDDQDLIAASIGWASTKADLIIISGGLGPTEDDLTRQALAQTLGVELVEDAESMKTLEAFFASRGYQMAERNRVQALCPAGASMIPNTCGTAPGIRATVNRAEVFVTPGVPREMKAMVETSVIPVVQEKLAEADDSAEAGTGKVILAAKINTFGYGESDAAEKLGDLMQRDRNPVVGTTVSNGICSIRVRAEYPDADEAQQQLDDTITQVEDKLGPTVFGRDETTLQSSLVKLLLQEGKTVATAESCTGGMIGSLLTDVPGSSAAYRGGWVTYTNELKSSQLGVRPGVIEAHGAVSEDVVIAMAEGARQRSGADFAVAVSGVAGPGGGTEEKPVGTVWLALATPQGTTARLARLLGNRASIRDRAAKCALQMIRLTLLGQDLDHIRWLARDAAKA